MKSYTKILLFLSVVLMLTAVMLLPLNAEESNAECTQHRLEMVDYEEATCSSYGWTKYVCSVCGYIQMTKDPIDTHQYAEIITYEPATCTTNEKLISYCYYGCGSYIIEEVEDSKTDHSGEWEVVSYSTCVKGGKQLFRCAYCDYTYEQNTGKSDHTYVSQLLVIPTKTTDGMIKYTCSYCGTAYTEVVTLNTITASDIFKDVKEDAWYADAVTYCFRNGYVSGITPDQFAPSQKLTRAQFVMLLANLDGVDLTQYKNKNSGFSDVKTGQWYHSAVAWAAQNGYASGTGGGKFSPNSDVTREQLARFFFVYAEKKGGDLTDKNDLSAFADSGKVSAWALDSVKWAVSKGIISGTTPTTLSPRNTATRAQASQMMKVFSKVVKYSGVFDAMYDYIKTNGRGDISQYYYVVSEKNQYSTATYYRSDKTISFERIVDKGIYYEFKFEMDAVKDQYDFSYYCEGKGTDVHVNGVIKADGLKFIYSDSNVSDAETSSLVNTAYEELMVLIDKILEDTIYTRADLFITK